MGSLFEEIDELLSLAKYMEDKQPNTAISDGYWTRLCSACKDAQQLAPETLQHVVPDDSQRTWAEALLCLEAVGEAIHSGGS